MKLQLNKQKKALLILSLFALSFLLESCQTSPTAIKKDFISKDSFIVDFSQDKSNSKTLKYKINTAKNKGFVIVHLGDSHTAADLMTGATRKRLQQYLGTGALGFIEPLAIPGQGNALISYKNKNVTLYNSHNLKDKKYLIGGYIASFTANSSVEYNARNLPIPMSDLHFQARCTNNSSCRLDISSELGITTIHLKSQKWEDYSTFIKGNFTFSTSTDLEVAGLELYNTNKGVTYTAIGSNGATIYHLDRWQAHWYEQLAQLKPDLVILSFGTNESFNDNFNSKKYYQDYVKLVKQISKYTNAKIMITGTPDSLNKGINSKLANSSCNNLQHDQLDIVNATLEHIAYNTQSLYWDWRTAMGGKCSALKYLESSQMRNDAVHFTIGTYQLFGNQLAHDLLKLAGK